MLHHLKDKNIAYTALATMMLVYTIVFTYIPWTQQDAFATFGYDLGYVDNRVWLVNQFMSGNIAFDEMFSTVGGMHIFGNHVEPILFLLAPFFWIWADVKIVLFLQTAVIALGAIPVYLIAHDKIKSDFVPLVFAFAYLMYPALQFINLFHFHSEAIAITALLFSFYFATKNRYIAMFVFAVLAIATKEDIALVTLLMGGYVFLKYDRRFGAALAALSIVWFIVSITLIFPFYVGQDSGHIFQVRYGAFGDTFSKAAIKATTDPAFTYEVFMRHEGPRYAAELLIPTAFLALLSPETLVISLSMFTENVLSAHPLQQTIRYQYNSAIIPFVFISFIYGYVRLTKRLPKTKKYLPAFIFAVAFVTNVIMSPSPLSTQPVYYIVPEYATDLNHAVSLIPEDARVSAHYAYVPHLSHRQYIYEFPNPFKCSYWGLKCQNQHDEGTIEYVMLNKDVMPDDWKGIVDRITVEEFIVEYETERVLLLRRMDY